jgi:hypothetical protein
MLERLTRWENNDKDVADLIEGKSDFDGLTEAINRLAEYEDSELSPEEVQELAKAKADGRLVVLYDINPSSEQSVERIADLTREAAESVLPACNVTKLPCAGCNPVCEHRGGAEDGK